MIYIVYKKNESSLKNALSFLWSRGIDSLEFAVLRNCTGETVSSSSITHTHFGLSGQSLHDWSIVFLWRELLSVWFEIIGIFQCSCGPRLRLEVVDLIDTGWLKSTHFHELLHSYSIYLKQLSQKPLKLVLQSHRHLLLLQVQSQPLHYYLYILLNVSVNVYFEFMLLLLVTFLEVTPQQAVRALDLL